MSTRVALITGAGRRIGAEIATQLHALGFHVVIHYHQSHTEAMQLVDGLNHRRADSALMVSADLTQPEAIAELYRQVFAWHARLDVLVNNASLFLRTPVPSVDDAALEAMWVTNVKAPLWLSDAAYPELARVKGCIVNITDIHAEKPLKGYSGYCQTKAALKMQTEALARDYAPLVRVNAVAPGAILWPEASNALALEQQNKIIEQTPLQCHGSPVWIAMAVRSLIENPFITGQTLRVDGGRSLGMS
jgi:pteridine reductase